MSLKDDAIEIVIVVGVVAAAVWYVESKYQEAGGVTGLASNLFSYASGAVLDALPSSQVPEVVDTVQAGLAPRQTATVGEYLYESALMGGGS